MVHLSVAHCLVQDHGYPATPEFYLGSIAPDAIHVRPGTDQKDKYAVHLVDADGPHLDRLRALLTAGKTARSKRERTLVDGYAAHILTDVAWRVELIMPFRRRFVARLSYPELRTLYYNECDKLDYDLYDEQPWRPEVWELLREARALDVGLEGEPPLLAAAEIDGWRERTLGWFELHREKASYQPQHMTREQVWPFIPRTAAQVAAQLAELRTSQLLTRY
jgi:hypothetical protein